MPRRPPRRPPPRSPPPDNGIDDGDVWVTITATADDFTQSSTLVLVTNTSAPDLIATGPIWLLLPDVPWLSGLNGNTLPSLAPGETTPDAKSKPIFRYVMFFIKKMI